MTFNRISEADTRPIDDLLAILHQVTQVPLERQFALDLDDLLVEWDASVDLRRVAQMVIILHRDPARKTPLERLSGGGAVRSAQQLARIVYVNDASLAGDNIRSAIRLRNLYRMAYQQRDHVLIVIAYRLISLSLITEMSHEDRMLWVEVNRAIFLPLFRLHGMETYTRTFADLNLRLSEPSRYAKLNEKIEAYYEHYQDTLKCIKQGLASQLDSIEDDVIIRPADVQPSQLEPQIFGRSLTLSRFTVDLLCEAVETCYKLLGLVQMTWPAISANGIEDWIAVPRRNGYRAIHMTVAIPSENEQVAIVDFHIRTHRMEQINTYGVVAANVLDEVVQGVWWEDKKLAAYITSLSRHSHAVGVFTPAGEFLYPFPEDSSVVDFAFRIHSDLGPYAQSFTVNGKRVDYRYTLRPFDLVSVGFASTRIALTDEWHTVVRTTTARRAINRFLRKQSADTTSSRQGREMTLRVLDRERAIYRLRMPASGFEDRLQTLLGHWNYHTVDELYRAVARGEISPDDVVATVLEADIVPHIRLQDGRDWKANQIRVARTWMQEKGDRKWDRSLRVMPGEPIIGRINETRQPPELVVFRKGVRGAPAQHDAVPLNWRAVSSQRETLELVITVPDQAGILTQVLQRLQPESHTALDFILFQCSTQHQGHMIDIELIFELATDQAINQLEEVCFEMQDNGLISDFRAYQMLPSQKMLVTSRLKRRYQNPFTLRQIRDRTMFYGRDVEISRIIQHIHEGESYIVLYGQKRIGKSSLLHQLAENILPETTDVLPVFLDALQLSPLDAETLLFYLVQGAVEAINQRGISVDNSRNLRLSRSDLSGEPFQVFAEWVRQIELRLHGTRLMFLIDEFTKAEQLWSNGELDDSFFDGMQWLVGSENVACLICVHDHIYQRNSRTWPVLQRGNPVMLGTLDRPSARRLIQQPLSVSYSYADGVVDELLDLTACHPYFIHAICLELASGKAMSSESLITWDDLQSAVSKVLRTGKHYFAHFLGKIDDYTLTVLKCIAFLSQDDDPWVLRDDVRVALDEYWHLGSTMQLSHSLGRLYQNGIIETHLSTAVAKYRIPIRLFELWLRQRTHPLIAKDLRRQD